MSRTLRLALLALVSAVGLSQASSFTDKGLSLLSYQLCSYLETQSVQKVEVVQTSHMTYVSCGGWIPWRRCPKTVYRTQYRMVEVPKSRNVTDCCEGYEQLGLYCVLPLNRSAEFALRPGVCPAAGPAKSTTPCSLDTDCPGLQKCCAWSGGHCCMAPIPQDASVAPERTLVSWYNVTVLVKMDFEDLQRVDPRLQNHTRLLYSLVTSALQPLDTTVHYLSSAGVNTSTTVSWLLLGLPRLLPVANVSAVLDDVVKRVYEVISIQVQDVDECLHDALHACPGGELCRNTEGSYRCVRPRASLAPTLQQLNHTEDCPPIGDFLALNVTSSGFVLSWSLNSTQPRPFHAQVYRGEELLRSAWTSGPMLAVAGLEAGVLYRVRTSYQGCGANVSTTLAVKTDAQVFEVIVRILNRNLTDELLNCSSAAFQDLSRQLLHEVEAALPPAASDLHRRGKLRLQVVSLQAGSLIVRIKLTVQDPKFPVEVSTLSPMVGILSTSTVFQMDPQGTRVQDWDECAHSSEHDCSPAARCINLEGSYTCQCRTARDTNPSRAGRACEGDMVSTTAGGLSAATEPTTPALGMGTAASGPETPTLSRSPRHPSSSLAAGQALTPGPPSSRGDSGTAGQDRNSTRQDMEEEVPSMAPSLGTRHESATLEASTASPSAPWPTPGSPLGPTGSLLDSSGQLLANSTTEPPSWPAPTEGPTGHVVWHPSLPTQEPPRDSTSIQKGDPGPDPFPGPPPTSTATSLKPPACAPSLLRRVTVSNVTSTSFCLEWEAGLGPHPIFHLTVVSPRSPAMDVETSNTSVTLSELEPGVLYLIDIVARACEAEGARTHLKVRTVAQKLSGRVRIANVEYSESFHNTSSEAHRDFVELFSRVVRDSLPAPMRQHMDSGGVRMAVTSIRNGSVVVEFELLITSDLEVGEVSAAFLAALQNTSQLEVVGGDTVIQDYDECERREDDCAPGTSCQNTLGSFTCRCEGGAADLRVRHDARPCAGVSLGNTTQAPNPAWSSGPAGTGATPVPDASPAPQGPALRLNLSSAVSVLCEIEKVVIAIQRRFLQQEAIPEAALYLGQPACNVSRSNATHVLLVAGWAECGTLVQSNMTSTVVRTILRNDLSPEGVIHHLKILSPISCAFRNDVLASSGYTPQWGVYTIIEDLHGAGNFVTEMQLFIGDSPIPQNYSVSASEDVKIEVGLHGQKSSLKVVLTECWATPSSNARDPVTFGFINNSCPIPNTYTSLIQNGNSSKAQFRLRIFSFINNSIVYLHCKLRVCMENPGASCRISCNNFRLLRSSDTSATQQLSWGPLIQCEGACPRVKPGLGAGYILLSVVAVLVVVAGVVAFLMVHYQRMTGKYNIKIQSDNFSYQAFYK